MRHTPNVAAKLPDKPQGDTFADIQCISVTQKPPKSRARKLPDDLDFPLVVAVLNALVFAVARNVISLNMHLVVPSWVVFVHDVRLLLNVLDVFLAVWNLRA